jgi:hypothetical protein
LSYVPKFKRSKPTGNLRWREEARRVETHTSRDGTFRTSTIRVAERQEMELECGHWVGVGGSGFRITKRGTITCMSCTYPDIFPA